MNTKMGEIESLTAVVTRLLERVNDLEVTVDNLRVQIKTHKHGYVRPPVYGGEQSSGTKEGF